MLLFASVMGVACVVLVILLVAVTLDSAALRDESRSRGARRDREPE